MLAAQAIANAVSDFSLMGAKGASGNSETISYKENDSLSFEHMLKTSYVGRKNNSDLNGALKSDRTQPEKMQTSKDTGKNLSKKIEKDQSNVAQSKKVNDSQNITDSKNAIDTKEKVSMVAETMKESVKEKLNLNEEELLLLMQKLGFTAFDLLNPDNLKQLVLANAQTEDSTMLLTDETLGNQFGDLVKKLFEQIEVSQITSSDVLQAKESAAEFATKLSAQIVEEIAPEAVTKQKVDEEVSNAKNPKQEDGQESKASFSVVREDATNEMQTSKDLTDNNQNLSHSQEQPKSESQLVTQFVDQVVNNSVTNGMNASFSENLSEIHQIREITNQIVDAIKITIKPLQTSMELTLNPEHLGKVALNITSKEGVITASFTTNNQIAKEAIESQMQILKDNLSQQGIKVEAIEVTVSEFSFQQSTQMGQNSEQQQSANQSKKAFRVDAGEFVLENETVDEEENLSLNTGTQFDYSA